MSDDEWTPETWRERGDEHLERARHAIESGNTALALSDIHQAVEAHMKAAIMAFNGMNSWTVEFRGLRLDNHKLQTLAKRGGLSEKLNERARQSV
ncbi:MAG: HEPN domain-containing protein, partial [Thermohalobaculum sp.]|nr:HEPN domain-containing protein [Thermohalobaculum sp.]